MTERSRPIELDEAVAEDPAMHINAKRAPEAQHALKLTEEHVDKVIALLSVALGTVEEELRHALEEESNHFHSATNMTEVPRALVAAWSLLKMLRSDS